MINDNGSTNFAFPSIARMSANALEQPRGGVDTEERSSILGAVAAAANVAPVAGTVEEREIAKRLTAKRSGYRLLVAARSSVVMQQTTDGAKWGSAVAFALAVVRWRMLARS